MVLMVDRANEYRSGASRDGRAACGERGGGEARGRLSFGGGWMYNGLNHMKTLGVARSRPHSIILIKFL